VTDAGRIERLALLTAIEAALTDPVRLVHALADAEDEADALAVLRHEYGIGEAAAGALLDLQVRRVTRAQRARVIDELRVLRAEWGPALAVEARFGADGSAVLTLEGAVHGLREGDPWTAVERLARLLTDEVARPRLRPVAATIRGLPDGPTTMRVTPAGDVALGYPDDPRG
jgi:hypothetical protein